MNEFKIGTYIRNKDYSSLILKIISKSFVGELEYYILSNSMQVQGIHLKKWIPLNNEFCWFWDNEENLQLRKFDCMDNKLFKPYDSVMGYKNVEPFFGELPTILNLKKDIK